jgi:hypothetical protein
MQGLGSRPEHIAQLMEPAALMRGLGIDLIERALGPQRPVTDGQARAGLQTPGLEVAQHIQPGFGGLAQPIADGHPLLAAVGDDPDDRQQAEFGIVTLA